LRPAFIPLQQEGRPMARGAKSRSPRRAETDKSLKELQACVLNLSSQSEQATRCEEMLKNSTPWLNFAMFAATDEAVESIPESEIATCWNTKHNALYGQYQDIRGPDGKTIVHSKASFQDPGVVQDFLPGERGCAYTHMRLWQQVVNSEAPALVLHDDAQIVFQRPGGSSSNGTSFAARLELGLREAEQREADVLYLNWSGFYDGCYRWHKPKRGKKSPVVRKAEYVWTSGAYVIWPKGAQKLLAAAKPMNQPVDNFMAWECREERLNSWVLLDEADTKDAWCGGIISQVQVESCEKKPDGVSEGAAVLRAAAKAGS